MQYVLKACEVKAKWQPRIGHAVHLEDVLLRPFLSSKGAQEDLRGLSGAVSHPNRWPIDASSRPIALKSMSYHQISPFLYLKGPAFRCVPPGLRRLEVLQGLAHQHRRRCQLLQALHHLLRSLEGHAAEAHRQRPLAQEVFEALGRRLQAGQVAVREGAHGVHVVGHGAGKELGGEAVEAVRPGLGEALKASRFKGIWMEIIEIILKELETLAEGRFFGLIITFEVLWCPPRPIEAPRS